MWRWPILLVLATCQTATLSASSGDVADILSGALAAADVPAPDRRMADEMLKPEKMAQFSDEYLQALGKRLSKEAHDALRLKMPPSMRGKMRTKVSRIRESVGAGELAPSDLNRLQLAMMKRTRPIVTAALQERIDAIASEAVTEQRLLVAYVARKVAAVLPYERLAAFRTALQEAGAAGDETPYFHRARAAVRALLKEHEPDLSGLVDERTGAAIAKDEDLASPRDERCLGAGVAGTLEGIVTGLDLPPADGKKLLPFLLPQKLEEFRATYRQEARARLFNAAQAKLRATMAETMPKKMQSMMMAIRMRLRAGPPPAVERKRVRFAAQAQARQAMMVALHRAADQVADEAAADDRLIASLRAAEMRKKIAEDQVVPFDAALTEASIFGQESEYVAKVGAAIGAAIAEYEPQTTGIIDPKTGRVVVDEEAGIPAADPGLWKRVQARLCQILRESGTPDEEIGKLAVILSFFKIESDRTSYCMEVRDRLFGAAHTTLRVEMPKAMANKIQLKISAVRERAEAGAPLSAADRARVQSAVMAPTRGKMMGVIHATADELALEVVKDEALVTARVARALKAKMSEQNAGAFTRALQEAGVTGDEGRYLTEVKQRVAAAVAGYEPDLTGIVDLKTGEVVAEWD